MRWTPSGEVLTQLILEVFRLNGRLLSGGDDLTRPVGQTSARWQVLGALDEGSRTVADIGRWMGLTRQSVQRTTDLLEAGGLVSYVENPAHQRAKLAVLTSRGRATLDTITQRQIEWANRVASRLPDEDVQRAIRTLHQVREAVDVAAVSSQRQTKAERPVPTRRRSTHKRKRKGAS